MAQQKEEFSFKHLCLKYKTIQSQQVAFFLDKNMIDEFRNKLSVHLRVRGYSVKKENISDKNYNFHVKNVLKLV